MELQSNQLEFLDRCKEAREFALSFLDPLIVYHHDADGVSSGAIAVSALKNAGKSPRTKCIKKLDDSAIDSLLNEKEIIFTDLGGGNTRVNELKDVLIIDHHQTKGINKFQINPELFSMSGSDELSGASTAYCVFQNNVDLGITGAVGDMQSPMIGMNRFVLEQGVDSGEIHIDNDLRFYGRYSRALLQFLMYSDDPYIPMISYNEERAQKLLNNLGINPNPDGRWSAYCDLDTEQKKQLISELANILLRSNMVKKAGELIGESYVFPKHKKDETYEANEFSTLLNACGRHNRSDIGLRVCLGDESAFEEARNLLTHHRKMIKEGIVYASRNIQDMGPFFLLDARGIIDESILGTVCGMVQRATWVKPIIGLSLGEHDTLKISSRTNKSLIEAGLNLGSLMNKGTDATGGIGGGHKIAAGASIPKGKINEFLLALGEELRE